MRFIVKATFGNKHFYGNINGPVDKVYQDGDAVVLSSPVTFTVDIINGLW